MVKIHSKKFLDPDPDPDDFQIYIDFLVQRYISGKIFMKIRSAVIV